MSPRPTASRHDATARQFLSAAAQLIDISLDADPEARQQVPRLRTIHFPAALDWLRVEDVVRMAKGSGASGVSKTAFLNRWRSREDFIKDAVIYTMLYQDGIDDPAQQARRLAMSGGSLAGTIINAADGLLAWLSGHPRSLLLVHMGPLLRQHDELWQAVVPGMYTSAQPWVDMYTTLIEQLGIRLRPGWTVERMSLALLAFLDGFVLRNRIHPDHTQASWEGASLFADTVLAFVVGIVDTGDGRRVREVVDEVVQLR